MLTLSMECKLAVSSCVLRLQVALEGAVSKKAAMTSLAQGLQPQVQTHNMFLPPTTRILLAVCLHLRCIYLSLSCDPDAW